jgi:hypothetical protein
MRYAYVISLLLMASQVPCGAQPIDTVAAVAAIETRMTQVDQSPLVAEFVKLPGQEDAIAIQRSDTVPQDAEARYELYGNEDGSIAGLMEFTASPAPGVERIISYYFDEEGSTVAVWWRLKWTGSKCTDSLAVETRYTYVFPANNVLLEYATLTDGQGNDLDAPECLFPDLELSFDTYYHRDWVLAMKHINLE